MNYLYNLRLTVILMTAILCMFSVRESSAQAWAYEMRQEHGLSLDLFFLIEEEMEKAVGLLSPNLTFEQENGSQKSLSSFKGKTVVVNLMRTVCAGCAKQFPALSQLHKKFSDNNLEVLFLSPEPYETIRKYADENSLTGNLGHIADRNSLEFPYQLLTTPTTIVIDENGVVRDVWMFSKSYEKIEARIDFNTSENIN